MTPDIASTVAGLLVLVVVGWDLVVTVLSPTSGAGPVTGRTGQFLWRLGKLGVPTAGARRLRVLGPAVLLATVLGWIVLLVLGWWLVTLPVDGGGTAVTHSDPTAVVAAAGLEFLGQGS